MTTGSESLNEQIARALGWVFYPKPVNLMVDAFWRRPDGEHERGVPDFEHSIDALKGAEKVLHQAGWSLETKSYPDGWTARWITSLPSRVHEGDTEAEARAKAALAALTTLTPEPVEAE